MSTPQKLQCPKCHKSDEVVYRVDEGGRTYYCLDCGEKVPTAQVQTTNSWVEEATKHFPTPGAMQGAIDQLAELAHKNCEVAGIEKLVLTIRPTPRTDSCTFGKWVPVNFAKKLENELDGYKDKLTIATTALELIKWDDTHGMSACAIAEKAIQEINHTRS